MAVPGWTAVVVNYNGAGYLEACLLALQQTRPAPADVIVVDNASTDDSIEELHGFPRANVLAQRVNLGFAAGANIGLAAVETEFAFLMNPDVEVDTNIGQALLDAFERDHRLGAAGALLRFPDTTLIQHAGGIIDRPLMTTRHFRYREPLDSAPSSPTDVDFVTGGAIGLRMSAFHQVGGFDEGFSPVYYEDVDLSVRLREAGWRVQMIPAMQAGHHEGVTLEQSDRYYRHLHRNRIRFALKHLSGHDWRTSFVPAEHARLRHELHTLMTDSWPERSGAAAIESLLRGFEDREGWDEPPMLLAPPPPILADRVAAARELATIPDEAKKGSLAFRLFSRLGPGRMLRGAFDRQADFNQAVVHALEAQDVMNREQTAMTLLLALDLLGQLQFNGVGRGAPPTER